jgi:hypothetical protein
MLVVNHSGRGAMSGADVAEIYADHAEALEPSGCGSR